MSPRKYIPIPKEQQKKRGRKNLNDTEPIAQPEPTPQPDLAPQPEPTPQPEPIVQTEQISEPIAIAEALAEPPVLENRKDIPDELSNLLDEYNGGAPDTQQQADHHPHAADTPTQAVTPPTSAPRVSLVRGYMLLLVLDFVLPSAITIAMRKFGGAKWAQLKSKDIRLSDSEFNDLEPIADEVAKDIQLNISPMTQLLLGMAVIYSSKLMFNEK